MSAKPALDDAEWRQFGQRITAVADYVANEGLRFAYHHHAGTVVETASDLDRYLAETGDRAGLVLDTGHAHLGGIDCTRIIIDHPERIVHVHCKDVREEVLADIRSQDASFLTGVLSGMFTVPGDGTIPFAPVMAALADISYAGWIVVEAEQDPAKADPRTYSELGLTTLQRIAADVGLLKRVA